MSRLNKLIKWLFTDTVGTLVFLYLMVNSGGCSSFTGEAKTLRHFETLPLLIPPASKSM
jgi:hypothetical protein